MQLKEFQDCFSAALWAQGDDEGTATVLQQEQPGQPQVPVHHPAFAVYRNTVRKACVDALQANYPTVCAVVGEAWFRAFAQHYARQHPPHDARLMLYGEGIATFLESFAPAAQMPYLPMLARLDRYWCECHVAPNAPPLPADWIAQQSPETLAITAIRPHPTARWLWSEYHPACTLWQLHREGLAIPEDLAWQPDGALLTRPGDTVLWVALPPAGMAFLNACQHGLPLQAAAEQAWLADPQTDLSALIALLLRQGALALPEGAY